jgi:hypothetical protein
MCLVSGAQQSPLEKLAGFFSPANTGARELAQLYASFA